MRSLAFLTALAACGGSVDLDVDTPEEVAALCAQEDPDPVTLTVSFDARPAGCAWGQDGNLDMAQGVVTARVEGREGIDVPEGAVVCGLDFEFQVDPQVDPTMEYDDHMFFLFDDVILAASNRDLVASMPVEDGLPVYDWQSIAGQDFAFSGTPTWCLGEDEGRSDCVIPDPETRDSLLLRYDDDLVDELAVRARRGGGPSFGFVVIGDNDPELDCRHEAFSFEVDVPYVAP
jgi:hypothetical protein